MKICGKRIMDNELRKIQLIDTDILNEIVKIANKYDLKYYMIGGTLLGAIRHKGFIPWDDDVDIAMPRKDYELFLSQFKNKLPQNLEVINFKTDSNYKYYITRVEDKRFKVNELRNHGLNSFQNYLSVDIFPIDGTPNNIFFRKIYFLRVMFYRAMISLIQKDNIDYSRKRKWTEKLLIFVGTKLPIDRFFSVLTLQNKIDKLLKQQKTQSEFVGTIMGAYRTKEIVPRIYFGDGKYYEFEGRKYLGPSMSDKYLKHMYGDYMKTPSKKQRKSKRHYTLINEKENNEFRKE